MARALRQTARRIAPDFVRDGYRAWSQARTARRAARSAQRDPTGQRSARDVFAEVYERRVWGGRPGEFYSGDGSDDEYAEPYCRLLLDFAAGLGRSDVTVVDLGCGDFRIGRRLAVPPVTYVGVDVVPALIERNRREHGDGRTTFMCLDIVEDELPRGDICLVRQVLQHLSNAEIERLLPKLDEFEHVFVTEHHPSYEEGVIANLDKAHGPSIRQDVYASAVYLDRPPFDVRGLECVLALPHASRGELRTFRYRGRVHDPPRAGTGPG